MLTPEEKDEIINAAVERTLLMIPEVVGNLMANHAMLHKINKKFYEEHPEFSGRKDIVQAVIEYMEGKNPTVKYEELLQKAVPEIKRRLTIAQDVEVKTSPKELPRDFSHADMTGNGCI